VLLAVAAVFLWRLLGDEVPGASVARDSIDSSREPRVSIANGPGDVVVEGANGPAAVGYEVTRYAVAGDPEAARNAASEVPVDVTREDSAVTLETDGGGQTGADYAVEMPAGGGVEVEAEEGDVEVTGLDGNVTVRAEAGDVTVRDVAGDVTVEAEQGDVTIGGMRTDTGNLELTVGSGDVTLEDLIVGTLEAAVEAGDVTLSGRFSGEGRVSVETGDITADLPSGDATNLAFETLVGGISREPSGGSREEGDGG
jgi:phage tail sheath gpL-like